jgi:hypothetical protein
VPLQAFTNAFEIGQDRLRRRRAARPAPLAGEDAAVLGDDPSAIPFVAQGRQAARLTHRAERDAGPEGIVFHG